MKKVKKKVNAESTSSQPHFNTGQMAGKRARHVLGLDRGYGSAVERVGRPVPKHADL